MTHADIHDIVLTACILAAVVVAFFAAGFALGWLEASVSLRFVPPWKRKASGPRQKAATMPAGSADATSALPADQLRRAS